MQDCIGLAPLASIRKPEYIFSGRKLQISYIFLANVKIYYKCWFSNLTKYLSFGGKQRTNKLTSGWLGAFYPARERSEAATRFYPPPTPSGAVRHNPKSGSGQFLGRTLLKMHFTRVGVKSKIGHTTRVDAYVCLALHAGRVKRVKCVKRAILGKIRE